MFTFDIVLNILLTALLGYVTLNTVFRFHFTIDRILLLFAAVLALTIVWYQDTDQVFEFGLTVALEMVAFGILKLVAVKKKNYGYFLFNIYVKEFGAIHQEISAKAAELEIARENVCHRKNRPFLLVFRNEDPKKVKALIKSIDTIHTHGKITFTMYNYWFIIAFIVLEIIIWRF